MIGAEILEKAIVLVTPYDFAQLQLRLIAPLDGFVHVLFVGHVGVLARVSVALAAARPVSGAPGWEAVLRQDVRADLGMVDARDVPLRARDRRLEAELLLLLRVDLSLLLLRALQPLPLQHRVAV